MMSHIAPFNSNNDKLDLNNRISVSKRENPNQIRPII
jgi:hypothetical protein